MSEQLEAARKLYASLAPTYDQETRYITGIRKLAIDALKLQPGETVLDAGCGEGFYLGSLAAASGCEACGVDISISAIDAAARKYPDPEWVVANADRAIPYADASFSLVMSITARMNSPEFRRVLRRDGRLLVAIPAPDDLAELRGEGRDRTGRTIEMFADAFSVVSASRVTTHAELDRAAVQDIRHAIYRPLQTAEAEAMRVTFSLDLLLFRPR